MTVSVITFTLYRGGYDGAGDKVLGAQVGTPIDVTVTDAAVYPQANMMFIDPSPPEAGVYFLVGTSDSGAKAFDADAPVIVLTTGP
jgi:hypothetical protein